ncbi:MAG: SUMF1/EgtB/PvdO family nonheme iron enzyme [Candidatus Methylumidiphilus sp.]
MENRSLVLALLLSLALQPAWAERKALIIGNANYAERRLQNAGNDADDIAVKLTALGFRVTPVKDADKRALNEQLEKFRASLAAEDDAVIYYAGHGAQSQGVNYLIPLQATIHRDKDLQYEAVDLQRVLDALDPVQTGLKLVILDACRNNPYPGSDRSGSRGLARVVEVPNQPLLWFAAAPGEVADDGAGRNGLFTGQLLKFLDKPGLKAEDVFKQVTRAVIAATQGKSIEQHPQPVGQTLVDFYFAEAVRPPPEPGPGPNPQSLELALWNSIQNSQDPAVFKDYLRQYPQGVFAATARSKLAEWQARVELALWDKIKDSQTAADFEDYLRQYPQGKFVKLANRKLNDLQPPPIPYGIEMVRIPGGTFQMGCGPKDGECRDDEKPRHAVTLGSFAIAKTEVTQGQWKAVMGSNPSSFKDCGDDCPVESVSWDDAQAFIEKLNKLTQHRYGFRLPTEAEWEYACRAGQETLYCGGDDVDAVAWYGYEKAGKTTHPVKGKKPNSHGLYDMSGNVWEWVQDGGHPNYRDAPKNGSAWETGADEFHVIRGGYWYVVAGVVRCAYRNGNLPNNRFGSLGFRLLCGILPGAF